jgi:NAD(P)-dependent dehydrogenase (short-subunit alcohol dehydrogenase family)
MARARRNETWLGIGGAMAIAAGTLALARTLRARQTRMRFDGQSVLITGGTRGLGLLLAEEFGSAGARVSICGRDQAAVDKARLWLRAKNIDVMARACDLGDRGQAEQFVDEVALERGGIDVLVNDAGVMQVGPLETVTAERVEEVMRSNFFSAAYVTLAALPYLQSRENGPGRIANITSFGGRLAVPHMLAYTASKHAMLGFSEALRVELGMARDGVRVTTVIPGPMRTGSAYNAQFAGKQHQEFRWFALAASLPVASIDGRRAARRIVRAVADGAPRVNLGATAWALEVGRRVAPDLMVSAMQLFARMLPEGSGYRGELARGRDVAGKLAQSPIMKESNEIGRRTNEPVPRGAA